MARELIRLDNKRIFIEQMKMPSITVDKELPAGNGLLARGHDTVGVQVGP
ncbi:hypothetical protein J1N35_043345 [Gossypium stocksii]|uniref:Uncharacterized protein n=1 Tax=Gossypium stocksii TaxID=47602 RepID=A0A9D3U7A2_9ROSI|nr:hypothetical protein J1N35_043345 [Gossypium stocksii]